MTALHPFDGGPTPLPWTPTIQAAAYVTGNCVGGVIELAGTIGYEIKTLIQSVLVADKDKQGVALDLYFFSANPSNSTFIDKSAAVINVADLGKVCGVAQVTLWTAEGIGFANNLALPAYVAAANSLWVAMVARGSATWTTISSLTALIQPVPAR